MKCVECKNIIENIEYNPFCSEICISKALETKKKNGNYSGGNYIKCNWCGKFHYRLPKKIKKENMFCSNPCKDSFKKYNSYLNFINTEDLNTRNYINSSQNYKNIIYKITNIINFKNYIGLSTKGLHHRIKNYMSEINSCNNKRYIICSMRKHGFENFKFEIIECFESISLLELGDKEKYWIEYYDSCNRKKGYNLALGGNVNSGHRKTEEQLKNLKKSINNRNYEGLNNPFYGKTHNSETLNRIIQSNRNRRGSKNKPMSEETKYKISQAKKGLYIG